MKRRVRDFSVENFTENDSIIADTLVTHPEVNQLFSPFEKLEDDFSLHPSTNIQQPKNDF